MAMSTPTQTRTSAAKAGWLIGLLFAGWLVFLLAPRLREAPAPAPESVVKRTPTRLAALGLEDITDLEQVPEMFAIWADFGEWRDNRTRFAYWSPGAQDYIYHIEGRRTPDGYRFRMIGKPTDAELGDELAADSPLRFYREQRHTGAGPARPRMDKPIDSLQSTVPVSVEVTVAPPVTPAKPADIKVDLPQPPPKK